MIAPTSLGRLGTLDWGDWAYGLISGFISGGSSAVTSGFVVSSYDQDHFKFGSSASLHLMGWVFVVAGLLSAFAFLRSKPLPEYKKTTEIEERSPHSTTVTGTGSGGTVEERSPHATKVTRVVEEVKPVGVTTTVVDPPKTTITEDTTGNGASPKV